MDEKTGIKVDNDAEVRIDFVRSGVVAFGKESGQPSQSLTSFISVEQVRSAGGGIANVSRSQIDTQATKTHKKENGSRAAMSLFCGGPGIGNSGAL